MIKSASRRDIFKLAGAAFMASQMPLFAQAASLATRTPMTSGVAPDLDARFEAFRTTASLSNLHSVLVLHQGHTALERYFSGLDETRGKAAGEVVFGPDTQHDLRSVTKALCRCSTASRSRTSTSRQSMHRFWRISRNTRISPVIRNGRISQSPMR